MSFSKLGLSDQLVQGILATGYNAPTEIQSHVIPLALAGRDIIGTAQTGTGKTAAFMLPILHHLAMHPSNARHPRALVLVPTRELAKQAEDFATSYGRFMSLRAHAVYGGTNMVSQIKRFQRGLDIVVATPGRLIDHMNRKTVDLSHVQILVLDEADRMFDMGFIQDVRRIISSVPAKRQTLLFSATISPSVKEIVSSFQNDPAQVTIGEQRRPADTVQQHFYKIHREQKLPLLLHLLSHKNLTSVLVFARTKHGADKITRQLEREGVRSVAIHSNRTQAQREQALSGFRNGQYSVMVATDIAARGIDVVGISHVVNFDTPGFAEDYIHRIGRTGRAESRGDSITFVSGEEIKNLRKIEQYTGKKYAISEYPGFTPVAAPIRDDSDRPKREPQKGSYPQRSGHPKKSSGKPRQHSGSLRPHSGPSRAISNDSRPYSGPPRPQSTGSHPHSGGSRPQSGGSRPQSGGSRPYSGPPRSKSGNPHARPGASKPYSGKPRPHQENPRQRNPEQQDPNARRTNKVAEGDWRKLIEIMDKKGSIGKKLKKFFE
jgi:ATP-dependent RNA helicase RhlE